MFTQDQQVTLGEKIAGLTTKALSFDTKLTPVEVESGFDTVIASLQEAKANYLANPAGNLASTIEGMTDDALQAVEVVLDAEGQTTWAGYVQDADNLLQYVTTHPAITKMVLSVGNLFKKKAAAATPAA